MTTATSVHERFMRRALALARRGGGRVSPNPRVGCVLARGGRVVAEGWHAAFGGPHAEADALMKAGSRARGSAAYVNLEPCCHTQKKTPPCVGALIRAGVRAVVIGAVDPNPLVSGRGVKELRRAGVRVVTGVLERECRALNREFLVRMEKHRPYVILKAAASLDGRIETAGGESKWITSPQARRAARRMRAEADAILAGVDTVISDDPSLTSHGLGRDPLRVILDSRLRVPPNAKILRDGGPTLVATCRDDFAPLKGLRTEAVTVMRVPSVAGAGRGRVDLKELLTLLGKLGIGTVLVEGGSAAHTAFLEAGLVDEVRLFLAPKLLGGAEARGFFEGRGARRLQDALVVSGMRTRRVGPDLLITGYLD